VSFLIAVTAPSPGIALAQGAVGASGLLRPDRNASENWSSAEMLSVGGAPNRTIQRCKSVAERA